MLVNFRVENFKSFKDFTEFSMEATKLKKLKESNTFKMHNISLLKSAVVYGANASGKSNLKNAMSYMKRVVEMSLDNNFMKNYPHTPFLLNSESENRPSFFEIEFIIDEIFFRYGFAIEKEGLIYQETLYQKKLQANSREVLLFKREKNSFLIKPAFKEGKKLDEKTRPNVLFLSVVAQFNGTISTKILSWFEKFHIISNISHRDFQEFSFKMLEDKAFKEKMVSLIKSADVGIHDIEKKVLLFDEVAQKIGQDALREVPKDVLQDIEKNGLSTIETIHLQYDKNGNFHKLRPFELELESEGTKKFLALSAPILDTLLNGEILLIDELDNSLHTELVRAIIKLFNSKESNPNHAQLIFTTHDTNLLDQELFRRDQIWFTEKDIYGATDLYSLVEYGKGSARNDLVLEKNYLDGKFGAKPHIGSLAFEVD